MIERHPHIVTISNYAGTSQHTARRRIEFGYAQWVEYFVCRLPWLRTNMARDDDEMNEIALRLSSLCNSEHCR